MSRQASRSTITLRGSAQIVGEFFGYAVNSILYQRGIYGPEHFERRKKYGLTMMISDWLEQGQLEKLVLVIANVHTKEVMERWTFDIETDKEALEKGEMRSKPEKEIQSEIQAIIRQITASVTFLPLLEDPCSFDLLVYTSKESVVPSAWEESDPRYIANSSQVRLRSFTTKVHKVDAMVAYRTEEE